MKKTIWKKKEEVLAGLAKLEAPELQSGGHFQFYHYTSLKVLFDLLDGDSFWASNVRFSNDAMETRMLTLENNSKRDDYIICFCSNGDMLSQWRGYCYDGGASIKLDFRAPRRYSILHADYEQSGKYEIYENAPLPVIYLQQDANEMRKKEQIRQLLKKCKYDGDIALDDILPYLKNGLFFEEKEARLVFSNIEGKLSKCIRFRTLDDGVKVPYMVVKSGDIGKMKGNCQAKIDSYSDEKIKNCIFSGEAIWIPEGYDQEKKYYEMIDRINKLIKDENILFPYKVYCRGHLPIEKITVAPTYDRDRKAEQIKRFCMSKYWLKNVVVEPSQIPYIRPGH